MKLISGSANPALAQAIADKLGIPLTKCSNRQFPDSEIYVEILENVRGEDVFVIQPTCNPTNQNLMELLIVIDALRRGSAKRITAVLPYFGYARQDRKTGPRSPISAKLVANLIEKAGANRVLTLDLHAAQIQGFFDIPTDNLFAVPEFERDISVRFPDRKAMVIVSPDIGGVIRARALASRLKLDLAIIDKRRTDVGVSKVMNVIGSVAERHCIMVDDIIDSAGTLCNAGAALLQNGATKVSVYCTHGVFSGEAFNTISASTIDSFTITDSIASSNSRNNPKIRYLSIANLLSEAISRIASNHSVSVLFT